MFVYLFIGNAHLIIYLKYVCTYLLYPSFVFEKKHLLMRRISLSHRFPHSLPDSLTHFLTHALTLSSGFHVIGIQ